MINNPGFYCNGAFLLLSILTSVILNTTIYSGYLFKYYDRILSNDASHFTKGGEPIDFKVKDDVLKIPENNELRVVVPANRNYKIIINL